MRLAVKPERDIVQLPLQRRDPGIGIWSQRVPPRAGIADREQVEVTDAPACLGTPNGDFLAIRADAATGAENVHRNAGAIQLGQQVGLAERWIGGVARLGELDPRRAEQALGDEDEMRDNFAYITAGVTESQPIRLDLPDPGPLLILHDDVHALDIAESAIVQRALGKRQRFAGSLDEIDNIGRPRRLQAFHQILAFSDIHAQRLFGIDRDAGLYRHQGVVFVPLRRAGDIDEIGDRLVNQRGGIVEGWRRRKFRTRLGHGAIGRIPHSGDLEAWVPLEIGQHAPPHDAEADDGGSMLGHGSILPIVCQDSWSLSSVEFRRNKHGQGVHVDSLMVLVAALPLVLRNAIEYPIPLTQRA